MHSPWALFDGESSCGVRASVVRRGPSEPLIAFWPAVRGEPRGGELERGLGWLCSVAVGLWLFLVPIEPLAALRPAACGGVDHETGTLVRDLG